MIKYLLILLATALSAELLDLNSYQNDFVIETKRIVLPEYPHAFNPSLLRWQDKILMSFRILPGNKKSFNSELGLVWLDENLDPISAPQLLLFRESDSPIPSRAEDGRLIVVQDRLLLVYSDCSELKISKGGFRVHIAELSYDGEQFQVVRKESLTDYPGATLTRREKNWVPFVYKEELLLAYSLAPHLIFRPLLWSPTADFVSDSETRVDWKWGELRGGTPALPIDGQYLAFFHTTVDIPTAQSDGETMAHYFMGAYTFQLEPPFALTQISPEPIVANTFYSGEIYQPYWKPVRAIFPCGFIHDDKFIWVAYGRQDRENWVVKLDKARLLKSLVPLN